MKTYDLPKRLAQQAMREVDKVLRDQHALGQFDNGDPNHPMYNAGINYTTGLPFSIFGYETSEFLGKQYK